MVAGALFVGACGGGYGSEGKDSAGDTNDAKTAAPAPAGPELDVAAKEFSFTPNTLTLKAGQAATVAFKNEGSLDHDMTVSDGGFKLTVPAGQTEKKTLTFERPGTYEFHCSVPGHKDAGMHGQITVE
jgi:uncharacterized cupredoxin-like copper-binding protein